MSNINNHGVDMNKINLATDFQELTCEQAAAIQGGAQAQIFTDVGFGGEGIAIVDGSQGTLVDSQFQDSISSVKVFSGEFTFWTDTEFKGSGLLLGPGEYDLSTFAGGQYHDNISSILITTQ